jgi:hypothetical protein
MVESTSWRVYPYWENGELVINSTGASTYGQYVAWRYSPISNTINITIHVTSFPSRNANPGFDIFSSTVGDQTTDGNTGFYVLLVDFYGGSIYYHSPTSSYTQLYTSLPQPNPNYPFTFTAILTENSAGNITVSTVYINSTAYTINVNTPFPWSQIGYVGIRGDINNLFYVSYFGVNSIPLSLTGGVVILSQSEKVTFYTNYQPNLVSSSTVSSSPPPTTTTTTTPTTTTTINPNQASVVINGSVYLTAPWLVHYSIPSVNSSVTAYLIYNYSINKPELVLSSPTNVNVNVTFTASNGTVLLSESVVSPTTVTLPMTTGNVTVKTTNSTVTIPLTYQRFTVISLTNAIANSPFLGATAILILFFVSFFIGFVFRTIPNSMALGSVVYITAVAPFLLAIGFPMSIVLLTVVLAVVALIYSIWALRVTNVGS